MERRYHGTDSSAVREELSKYLSQRSCPSCGGSRLNKAARHVFIEDMALPDITSLAIDSTLAFFEQLKLTGKRGEIADKIVKEIKYLIQQII